MTEMNRSYGQTETGRSSTGTPEERAKEIGSRARDQASELASRGRERAAEQLHVLAESLRSTGADLENKGSTLGRYVEKAAEQIDRFSDTARSKDPKDLMQAIERFARKDSALFLGGAMTLGLLAARFLRSSSRGSSQHEGRWVQAEERAQDVDVEYVGHGVAHAEPREVIPPPETPAGSPPPAGVR